MPQAYDLATLNLDPASEVVRLVGQFPDIQALSYGDGEALIREDETSQEIFIVLQGGLVVEKAAGSGDATAVVLACIPADPDNPVIVGEMAYLGAQRRTASVRSSGRSHSLSLEPRHVDAILESYPGLTRIICRQFSQRLKDTDRALRTLQGRFALEPAQRMARSGAVLFSLGEPAQTLFQLVAGTIRLEGPEGSREVAAEDLPQGFLDLGPFLTGGPHPCTATVQDMAFLAVIEAAHREAWVRCYPELVLAHLAQG